ncbi:MAG: phosphate ABC transporter permease subunit PstC [bacterium]
MSGTMLNVGLDAAKLTEQRSRVLRGFARGDRAFSLTTLIACWTVVIILTGVMIALFRGALPAFQAYGWEFFVSQRWSPPKEIFGGLPAIYGTLITSIIAMAIAMPVGLGIAIFLTETCPMALRKPIGIAVELLAGVPSIIYGIWGLFIFAPFLAEHVNPALVKFFAPIPLLNALFANGSYGTNVLTASLILSIMIIPFISSVSRDVFETVPAVLKEAAYGLGCTTWEVVRKVVIPHTRVGVIGGGMLALGRALGETMAVTFVIGNAHRINPSFLDPGTTISATIANEFTEADPGLYSSTLFALGFILFVITFIVLAAARLMLMRMERRLGN